LERSLDTPSPSHYSSPYITSSHAFIGSGSRPRKHWILGLLFSSFDSYIYLLLILVLCISYIPPSHPSEQWKRAYLKTRRVCLHRERTVRCSANISSSAATAVTSPQRPASDKSILLAVDWQDPVLCASESRLNGAAVQGLSNDDKKSRPSHSFRRGARTR
jgi:hypothetical protein